MIISQVDFLKFIFKKSLENTLVSVSEIAAQFNITTPSVTQALRSMTAKKWLDWKPRKKIYITELGCLEALKLIRKHRILECFLFHILKLDLWQVHVEAEKLEHVVSETLIEKMNQLCGSPEYDPHGHPIPSLKGKFPKTKNSIKLTELSSSQEAKVCLIDDNSLLPMKELVKNKITLGSIIQKTGEDNFLLNGKKVILSKALLNVISVEQL